MKAKKRTRLDQCNTLHTHTHTPSTPLEISLTPSHIHYRASKKATKNEKKAKKQLKAAMEKGNMEGARIYAANAIREKNQSLKFLQLSSRIDAVASRVQTAVNMNTLTKDMIKVTKGMKGVLRTMNPERITKVMDKFEQQFEDLDVVSAYQESAMDQNSSMVTPEGEVDTLMQQVADEHGLAVADQIQAAPTNNPTLSTKVPMTGNKAEDDLARRLAALKAPDN
ncbi:Snf7 family protein [bacterium]|nr:Snf7 family protein [bacterium]